MCRHRRRTKGIFILFFVFFMLCSGFTVCARDGYSYTYDATGKSVPVPVPYEATNVYYQPESFGGVGLSAPTDIYVADDDKVYVLDSGNQRIVVLDTQLRFVQNISLKKAEKAVEFQDAQGLFVSATGEIFVADKAAAKIYVATPEGEVIRTILAPPEDKVEKDFVFAPTKVLADSSGITYVLSANTYAGALQYDQAGNFLGYYGAERVAVSAELLWNQFWKGILSEKAAAGMARNVPTSFINFDVDPNNFIYTIKGGTGLGSGQVRKLNPLGNNILLNEKGQAASFGDLETYFDTQKNQIISSALCDLVVDRDGYITVLDNTRSRLFQYDQNANLLYAFGGSDLTVGNYQKPVAVESYLDHLFVLDAGNNSITVLEPTEFGRAVREATLLFQDGQYEKAKEPWESVLRLDANYELANIGMGKIFERTEDYTKAQMYYRRGNSQEGYSAAFAAQRDEWVRRHFVWIVSAIVAGLLLLIGVVIWKERHAKNRYGFKYSKWRYPFHCVAHPFSAYYDLKVDKKGSLPVSFGILLLFFLLSIIKACLTGFHYATVTLDEINIFAIFGSTIGFFAAFVLCNWACSTLFDGEGKFHEIWIFTAYALIPYLITLIVMTVASNVFALNESAFFYVIQALGLLWTGVNLFMATREVHQYTTGKTAAILLVTVLGMYLVMLIITIGYSMFTQLLSFITMVYNEIRLKV